MRFLIPPPSEKQFLLRALPTFLRSLFYTGGGVDKNLTLFVAAGSQQQQQAASSFRLRPRLRWCVRILVIGNSAVQGGSACSVLSSAAGAHLNETQHLRTRSVFLCTREDCGTPQTPWCLYLSHRCSSTVACLVACIGWSRPGWAVVWQIEGTKGMQVAQRPGCSEGTAPRASTR